MSMQTQHAQGSLTPTRLYLLRHGQVADGQAHLYYGNNDVELSPLGVRQLEEAAVQLRDIKLAGVYASDLIRASHGAKIICRDRELAPRTFAEFREIHFGVWEGLSFQEIAEHYPDDLNARFQDLPNFRIPGGESLMDVRNRVVPLLGDLLEQHQGQAFLIVAHAGVNRLILSEALDLSLHHIFRLDQNYGCLNIIDYFPDMAVVRLVNGGVNGSS